MMRIEFGDLIIDEEAKERIKKCLDSNWISGGPLVTKFENSWGNLFDYKYNIAVSNGTDADTASCMALYDFGAKRGDEIIAPALAFVSVGNSILQAGFKPAFVDIEKETLNINPDLIEERITPKTRAIMAVHTMGKPCEMGKISRIAKEHNLLVIEDSCESHGAEYHGEFIGHKGDLSCFSFYAAHIVSCGDGGMVSTNREDLDYIIRSVKDHGRKPGSLYFDHRRLGSNLRMNALVASIGISEIGKFWNIFNQRKKNLNYLLDGTKDLAEFLLFNMEESHEVTSPHAFSATLRDPKLDYKKFYSFLEENSIRCKRNFGSIPTQHKAFKFMNHRLGEFPEAEYVGDNGLHFGVHQYLKLEDLDCALDVLHNYFKRL